MCRVLFKWRDSIDKMSILQAKISGGNNMKVKEYQITHLTIVARDEDKMRAFYRDLFNAVETQTGENEYSYAFREKEAPFLTLQFGGKEQSVPQEGLYHFALLFPSAAELASLVQRLMAVRYPIGAGDHGVSEAIYLDDPDGNGIELYRDRPADDWHWHDGKVEMGTEEVDIHGLLNKVQHQWSGFPVGMTIGHLHFSGRDLTIADHFFNDFLALDTVSALPESAHFYSHNHYHHHHALNLWAGRYLEPKKTDEQGLVAWQVNVDATYFDTLVSRLSDDIEVISQTKTTLVVRDAVGSQMIINRQPND